MMEYGRVVLTLSDVLLPADKLYPNTTPSMNDGLDYQFEYDLRLIGCELIQTACLLLKLPQTAVATGQVLFHRYFYSSSFVRRSVEIVAMACTNLAAKIEEDARRVRDIINVFHHIKQVRSGKTIHPLLIDQIYIERKNEVIKAERRILKELGFCVYVKHPHKMITMYLKVLGKERDKTLVQTAWNYMNDSLRTDVFLRFTPETIACACIDLAARVLQIPLPTNPIWFWIFGAHQNEINYIMISILRLYRHRTKSLDELEKIVKQLREKRESEKKISQIKTTFNEPEDNSSSQTTINITQQNTNNSKESLEVNHHHHHQSKRSRSTSSSHHQHYSRRKERKHRRSRSSSPNDNYRSSSSKSSKHPLSTKDTNHQLSKRSNRISSSENKFSN